MIETQIQEKLRQAFAPTHLEIVNESHLHGRGEPESHFRVLIVSPAFEDVSRVARQRRVYDILKTEFEMGLHALTLKALSKSEWEASQGQVAFTSPACRHAK